MGIARIYLGVLLAAMALGQLLSIGRFLTTLEDYELAAAPVLAALLIALEVGAAVGLLLLPAVRRPAALLGLIAAVLWSLLAVQALARGLDVPNCGCFGAYLSQPLRAWVLPQDALFVLVAALVLRRAERRPGELRHPV